MTTLTVGDTMAYIAKEKKKYSVGHLYPVTFITIRALKKTSPKRLQNSTNGH